MRYILTAIPCLLAVMLFAPGQAESYPFAVGASVGFLAPAGDFGRDLKGGLSVSSGVQMTPASKLKVGLQFSFASLRGKGNGGLALQMLNTEAFGKYTFFSPRESVSLYGLAGIGNGKLRRTLGTGEENAYQFNCAIGLGGEVLAGGRTTIDGGMQFRRYFSKSPGDVILLDLGLWYGL
jgi:hypothetical protein